MDKIKNLKGGALSISHSGRDTFADCHRKWWYSYMERRRGPDKESTKTGSAVHECAEQYLKGEATLEEGLAGEDRRFWRILEPALAYAPSPEEVAAVRWAVETRVAQPCGPLPFKGFVDIHTTSDLAHPIVDDWKTTGVKGWRYTKSPEALAKHGQPLAYAYALHCGDPPEAVVFRHHNMYTKGKPGPDTVMPVVTEPVPWEDIAAFWEEVMIPAAEEMYEVATTHTDASTVPGTTENCKKYGGCEHAEVCALSPLNRNKIVITPRKEAPTMANNDDVKARLAAMKAGMGLKPDAKAKPAAITPKAQAQHDSVNTPDPTQWVKPTPPPSDMDTAVKAIQSMVEAMPNGLPVAAAQTVAKSNGVELEMVMRELNLRIDGVMLKALVAKAALPKGIVKTGTNKAEALAQHPGMSVNDIAQASGLKEFAGILVPKDFFGPAAKAYQLYRPGTSEAELAEVLEALDPTSGSESPLESGQPSTSTSTDTQPTQQQPSSPSKTSESTASTETTQSGSSATPVPSPGTDPNVDVAAELVSILTQDGKPLSKKDASAIVRTVDPSTRRVRKQRWDAIFEASGGQLTWEGDNVCLTGDEGEVLEAADPTQEVTEPSTTQQPQSLPDDEAPAQVEPAGADPTSSTESPGKTDGPSDGPDPEPEPPICVVFPVATDPVRIPAASAQVGVPEVFVDCYPAREDYVFFGAWASPFYDISGTVEMERIRKALNERGPDALPPALVITLDAFGAQELLTMLEALPVRIIRCAR